MEENSNLEKQSNNIQAKHEALDTNTTKWWQSRMGDWTLAIVIWAFIIFFVASRYIIPFL
jgi:hypothetical protein